MTNKFILGGGISGLLYAYYNSDFTIISPDIGGKLNHKFFENTILIHATKETEQFLKEVEVDYKLVTHVIKYYKQNSVLSKINAEDKVLFIQKKMDDFDFIPTDLNLSTSDYFISVYEVNYSDIISKLKQKISFIDDKVIRITDNEIITEKTSYNYSKIVSTINAKIFWSLFHSSKFIELNSKPATFVLSNNLPDNLDSDAFDLCYFLDKDTKLTRIAKKSKDQQNMFLYEFSGRLSKEECLNFMPNESEILEYYVDNDAIIFTNKNNIPPQNILFVGRFATWNHSDKQQDVIKIAKIDFELQNIWNIQKRFTSNFVDFNKLKEDGVKEKYTKDYFLALIPELSEALNEINYKQHKSNKKVNKELLLEELIDTFKYYLNILLMWDITPEIFIEAFKSKSKKVENLFNQKT